MLVAASTFTPVRAKYHPQLWVDVWQARDPSMYAGLRIPRSTRSTWRTRRPPERIVGAELFDRGDAELRRELDALKRRAAVLEAIVTFPPTCPGDLLRDTPGAWMLPDIACAQDPARCGIIRPWPSTSHSISPTTHTPPCARARPTLPAN